MRSLTVSSCFSFPALPTPYPPPPPLPCPFPVFHSGPCLSPFSLPLCHSPSFLSSFPYCAPTIQSPPALLHLTAQALCNVRPGVGGGKVVALCEEERGRSTGHLPAEVGGRREVPRPGGGGKWVGRASLTQLPGRELWAQREVAASRKDSPSPHRAGSGGAGRREHLEREAGRLLQAAGLAVDTSDEGDPGGRLRAQVEVVVHQLPPLHEEERALLVRGQLLRGEAHDGVGDGARLRDTESQGPPGTPRAPGPGLAPRPPARTAGRRSPGAPGSRRA